MLHFTRDCVFILPHTEEYRRLHDVSIEEVLWCLNDPDIREGLADDRFTAEKAIGSHRIYVYYYRTLPLWGDKDETYAIVDFIGKTYEKDEVKQAPLSAGNQLFGRK